MPLDIDYKFGTAAVRAGQLEQDQLEECVELLVALERVSSRKRVWDIISNKGYMTLPAIEQLRNEVGDPEAKDRSVEEAPSKEIVDEETEMVPEITLPDAASFSLAHMTGNGNAQLYPLPMRMVTIGRDSSCDIVLKEKDVLPRHCRLTCGYGKFRISRLSPKATIRVNGRRMIICNLHPNDLIELGSSVLLFLGHYNGEGAPEPTSPVLVDGVPSGRLRVVDGPQKGASFFLGSRPLVIGSHSLANVRMQDSDVSKFHAHVAVTRRGTRIVDLKSRGGTKAAGLNVSSHILEDGDNIRIGGNVFNLKILMPAELAVLQAEAEAKVETTTKPEPQPAEEATPPVEAASEPVQKNETETPVETPKATQDTKADAAIEMDWDVSLDVEVDMPSDPMIEAGMKPMDIPPQARPAPKPYKPGELRIVCVEGPLEGKSYKIKKTKTIFGRDPKADIRINDVSISRQHAEISLAKRFSVLRDLGSRNGIFVNGSRVTEAPLRSGDAIRIGKCLFIAEEVVSSK